ncbi:MAG: FAD-dependent oxidoreductase [Alphaproteobacteria bacterium]|nr:FAD-dependent oxidoreductase [Alphaproteobacteria bacterium]
MQDQDSPTQTIRTGCVISGGGPAGMVCGFLLARAGIDVVVLEKHKDFLRDFRGDTIHPSTLELLYELGLLERFLKLPHIKVHHLSIEIGDEKFTIGDFDRISTRCKFMVQIPQWDFLDFLSREAKAFPNFKLLMETKATDFLMENGQIAGVTAHGPQGALTIHAGLTIAADGRHSALRAKSGLPLKDIGAPFDVLWLRLPVAPGDPTDIVGRVQAGYFFVMIYRGDYWQCALLIPKGSFDAIKSEGIEKFREKLRQVASFARDRAGTITDFDQVKLLSVSINRLKKWARPGFVCIGDSAHAMSPVGGVGINLAIQDAAAAANILGPVLKKGAPALCDLEKIQRRRERPTKFVQWIQIQMQEQIITPALRRKTTPKPPLALKLLNRYPFLRRLPAQLLGVGQLEHVAAKKP